MRSSMPHERGIVHCDLKPANILLDECGRIRVTDFGLARSLAGDTPWTAEVEGTAPFMAPEQASRCWGPIDRRTDVYGIGAVLFTLLTGRPPFVGRRLPDILAEVIAPTPVISPARLRPGLSEPLERSLPEVPFQGAGGPISDRPGGPLGPGPCAEVRFHRRTGSRAGAWTPILTADRIMAEWEILN